MQKLRVPRPGSFIASLILVLNRIFMQSLGNELQFVDTVGQSVLISAHSAHV